MLNVLLKSEFPLVAQHLFLKKIRNLESQTQVATGIVIKVFHGEAMVGECGSSTKSSCIRQWTKMYIYGFSSSPSGKPCCQGDGESHTQPRTVTPKDLQYNLIQC